MLLDRIAARRLVGAAVSAMVHSQAGIGPREMKDLEVPDIAVGRPWMEKHDRHAAASPGLVINFDSLVVCVRHSNLPVLTFIARLTLTEYWWRAPIHLAFANTKPQVWQMSQQVRSWRVAAGEFFSNSLSLSK